MNKKLSINNDFKQLLSQSFFDTITTYTTLVISEADNKEFIRIDNIGFNTEVLDKLNNRVIKHIISAESNWFLFLMMCDV